MDHRFDTMEGNLMNVMETQAGVGGTMNKLSDKVSALMDMIAMTNIHTAGHAPGISTSLNETNSTATTGVADTNQKSFPSSPDSSNRQLDREPFSSPIKKKYRAGFNKDDMEDIGMRHDKDNKNGSVDGVLQPTPMVTTIDEMTDDPNLDSLHPFSQAVHTPLPPDDNTESSQIATAEMDEITTDLESRYKDQSSQGGGDAT
jgi:hypothetical protein